MRFGALLQRLFRRTRRRRCYDDLRPEERALFLEMYDALPSRYAPPYDGPAREAITMTQREMLEVCLSDTLTLEEKRSRCEALVALCHGCVRTLQVAASG